MTRPDADSDPAASDVDPESGLNQQTDPDGGDVLVKDADSDAGDTEELPEHQCVEVATETGERCRNAAIPGVDRCHAHVDYTELAETYDVGVDAPPTREEAPPGARP